jgi:hypothetical protein
MRRRIHLRSLMLAVVAFAILLWASLDPERRRRQGLNRLWGDTYAMMASDWGDVANAWERRANKERDGARAASLRDEARRLRASASGFAAEANRYRADASRIWPPYLNTVPPGSMRALPDLPSSSTR